MATDIITILVDEGLGNSSYLMDLGDGRGLVLDPTRDPSAYLAEAERRHLTIAFAVETHLHADFVSGSRELAARGATVVAPAAAGLEHPHRGLGDGDELDLGGLALRAIETPGHTPEHLSYLVLDGRRPLALFSGGSLMVGTVARTDLISPERTDALTRSLYRSLQARILTLPDDLPVYPTHGTGSFCSAPAGAERTTTIGEEKATNPLLAAADEDAFVRRVHAGLDSYPDYFMRLREVNRRGPTVYGPGRPSLTPLDVETMQRMIADGAWVVDARPVAAFGAGHIPGAVSIELRAAFATWLGWVVPPDVPLAFVLDRGQDRADLVRQARKVGYENLAGELAGGMDAWRAAGLPAAHLPLVEPNALHGSVLDVRQSAEHRAGRIPGSVHVELGSLTVDDRLPAGPLTVACGHGQRAMTGASLLARQGRRDLAVLAGGPADWAAATGAELHRSRA